MGRDRAVASEESAGIGLNGAVQISNRTKATLGLVGAAVVAGMTLGGGTTPDDTETVAVTSTAGASSAATSAASRAVSSAAASASAAVVSQAAGVASAQTVAAGSAPAATGSTASPAATGGDTVVLVLDSSGSMAAKTTGSTSRMDEARTAMTKVINELPADTRVGLRVYGSTVAVQDPKKPSAAACKDSRAVLPIGPVDKPRLQAVVSVFKPFGYTPTSYALEQAAADLPTSGKRAIILVSDGEESCPVDPASTAKTLRDKGIDLTISTVGLHAEPAASEQLRDVATAGGGTYTSARSASELENGLQKILDRMRSGQSGTNDTRVTAAAAPADQSSTTRSTTSSGSGTNRAIPAGFVSALLLLVLFLWLSDHK